MNSPTVAVIIPAFRAEKWLRACLASVAAQSFGAWQVIVVEDGSKDATEQIVKTFAANFPGKFTYLHSAKNIGPAAARNLGIRLSESQIVAFIDSDDLWTKDHLAVMVDGIMASGSDLAYSRITEFTAGVEPALDSAALSGTPRDVKPMDLFENSPLLPSCVLVRRKALLKMELFEESLRWAEDLDLWIRLMRSGAQFHDSLRHSCWRRLSDTHLTANSAKVAEYSGRLYLRHLDWPVLDQSVVRQRAIHYLTSAARMNFWNDPKLAGSFYYLSWRTQRWQLTNFGRFLLARLAVLFPRRLRLRIRKH